MAQIKFVVDDELAKEFKQMVLAKHGKLELSTEGEAALRLYLEKNSLTESEAAKKGEHLANIIGAVKSVGRHDALEDLRRLEAEN